MRQDFKFKYDDPQKVQEFIESFSANFVLKNKNDHYLITNKKGDFTFYLSIESFGLATDRSDRYFEFLGMFIDEITAWFGDVEIEDV